MNFKSCCCQQKDNKNKAPKKLECSFTGSNQKYKSFYVFFFVAPVIIVLLQTSYFFNSEVNDLTKRVNRYEKSTTCEYAEKTVASLARLMNAIALLNDMENNSKIIKTVITETLKVQNTNVFESINQSSLLNVKNVITALNSITVQKNNTVVKEVTIDLKKIICEETTPLTKLRQVLFVVDYGSSIKLMDFSLYVNSSVTNLELLLKKIKSPSSVPTNVFKTFQLFRRNVHFNFFVKKFEIYQRMDEFVNILENASSFIVYIEKYKQLTSMARLEKNLKSLLSSFSIIERSPEIGSKKRVMKQLFSIYRLLSTGASISDKQTLIGFPRGSEDMAILFKDLDELPLRKVLNEGKSLSQLESLLQPISNLSSELAVAERIWTGPIRIQYANLIRKNVNLYQKIQKFKLTAIISFLNNLNSSSEKLKPIDGLKNSVLDEFAQHLISLNDFSNYSTEKSELKNILNETSFLEEYFKELESKLLSTVLENDQIQILKNEDLSKLKPLLLKVRTKTSYLERQRNNIVNLLIKIAGFKDIFTEGMMTKIGKIVEAEQLFKSDINEVLNNIKFMNSLTPLTGEEFSLIDKLPENFLAAKNQINKWHALEETVKTETRKTKGYNRLKSFPYAWELTFQLTYLQRTLSFFKRRNHRKIFQQIFKNGLALAEKIKRLPAIEKQLAGSAWSNFDLFNQSVNSFLAEIEQMPCKIFIHEHNLSSLADAVSVWKEIRIPSFDIELFITSLDSLAANSMDLLPEVSVLKKNIEYLQDLQFAISRRNDSLSKLLTLADAYFKSFFYRAIESVTKRSKSSFNFNFFVIFVSVFGMCIF